MKAGALARCFLALVSLVGCGDATPVDAGAPDAGSVIAAPGIPWLATGLECPEGWRSIVEADVGACDAYPEDGPASCGAGEAHFPGEPGCRTVGDACPSGPFADTLPTGSPVIHIDASAAAGGDGSPGAPFAALSEVSWDSLGAGSVVAIARGSYTGALPLDAGVTVIGACSAETLITPPSIASPAPGVSATRAGEPAVLRNVTIADPPGLGALASRGGTLRLEGVIVRGAQSIGMLATGRGSQLVTSDVVVRDTRANDDDTSGYGITVLEGASLDAARTIISDNRLVALFGDGAGTRVSLEDVAIWGTESSASSRLFGRGIGVQRGAQLEADRLWLWSNRTAGIYASEVGTTVTLTDVVVRDTRTQESGFAVARGIEAQRGATISASRLLITRCRERGALVANGAQVTLADAMIVDTQARENDGGGGFGIGLQTEARLEADRVFIARNHELNVGAVGEGTTLVLRDSIIRDSQPRERNRFNGWGLSADERASVTAERVRVEGAHELGVVVFGEATIDLTDVSIVGTTLSAATGRDIGHGAAALGGTIRMTRFEVLDSSTCGLLVAGDPIPLDPTMLIAPSLDVQTGFVERSAIGACVQWDGYDLARLTRDVTWRDNGLNLETTDLPLPEPTLP